MEYQLLLEHRGAIYDATPILEEGVRWEAGIQGEAGRLYFSIVRDGVVNFVEGGAVRFWVDGRLIFSGWVMTKERTSNQIIFVTACDQLFYLAKNKETMIYQGKTATSVIRTIAQNHQMPIGELSESGWVIPQRIEEGQSLLDMIFSALEITKQATGREFFFFDRGGMLTLKEREELIVPIILRSDGGIKDYRYKTDISKDTYNTVKLYQAGRKESERLAYYAQKADKVKEWGQLQYYRHVPFELNQAQLKEIADQILKEKCRVVKRLTIENINGDAIIYAGDSIYIEIPELSEISLVGLAVVERCTHIFRDGAHTMRAEIRIEES